MVAISIFELLDQDFYQHLVWYFLKKQNIWPLN